MGHLLTPGPRFFPHFCSASIGRQAGSPESLEVAVTQLLDTTSSGRGGDIFCKCVFLLTKKSSPEVAQQAVPTHTPDIALTRVGHAKPVPDKWHQPVRICTLSWCQVAFLRQGMSDIRLGLLGKGVRVTPRGVCPGAEEVADASGKSSGWSRLAKPRQRAFLFPFLCFKSSLVLSAHRS